MIFASLFALAAVSAAPKCSASGAIYHLRGAKRVIAGFQRQRYQTNFASNVFFWVRTPDGRRWWFAMNAPNGSRGFYLSPDVDARKIDMPNPEIDPTDEADNPIEIDFHSFDRLYNVNHFLPQADTPAPAHLFASGLGPLLWYNPTAAANGDKTARSVGLPIAMFDLVTCN